MDEATRQKMLLVFNNFNEYIESIIIPLTRA